MAGDLFGPLADFVSERTPDRLFDMVVSNPPYIPSKVVDTLMEEVREHEPRIALDGREDGLYYYRKITAQSPAYLRPGGMLFLEIGYDQANAVSSLLEKAGFDNIKVIKDAPGLDRVVCGESIIRKR